MQTSEIASTPKVRPLLESAGASFSISHHQPRDVIFSQGDEGSTVMHIEEGRVKLSVSSSAGKGAICGVMGSGSFLGEDVIGGCALRRQTATAMVATEVIVVSRSTMVGLLQSNQTIAQQLIGHMLVRKSVLENDLTVQLLFSSEQRLIHTLLALAGCHRRCRGRYDLPKVSQETIAEMVGTTRSRVNHFMTSFKRLGFLEKHGGLLQINPSRLQRDLLSLGTGSARSPH
jgi:CRP/FNR family transcriptional regulator, cyclic AMP receptor protein